VQLQRQSSALGTGLPTLLSGPPSSTSSTFPPNNSTIQPGLSAFLTSDTLDDYGGISGLKQSNNNSNTLGLGSFSSSSTTASQQHQHQHHHQVYQSIGGGGGGLMGSGQQQQQQQLLSTSEIHPLHFNWVFWFMHRAPGSRILNYESAMKRIASFGSVSDIFDKERVHSPPFFAEKYRKGYGLNSFLFVVSAFLGGGLLVCVFSSSKTPRITACERLPSIQTRCSTCMGGCYKYQWW
jgi:hypothetical protein